MQDYQLNRQANRKLKGLIQNICEENEFVLGIFYAPNNKFLRSKGQVFYTKLNGQNIDDFKKLSDHQKHVKGEGQIGRVWESEDYEWVNNVQTLASDLYARKFPAVDTNLRACFAMAVKEKDKFAGVLELFLEEEWHPVPKLIEKVRYYLQA